MNIPDDAVLIAVRTFYGTALEGITEEDMQYAMEQMRETLEAAARSIHPCPHRAA